MTVEEGKPTPGGEAKGLWKACGDPVTEMGHGVGEECAEKVGYEWYQRIVAPF